MLLATRKCIWSLLRWTANFILKVELLLLGRAFLVLHCFLTPVHVCNLIGGGCLLCLFVFSYSKKAWKAKRDPPVRINKASSCSVYGRNRKIGSLHFPNLNGVKPLVGSKRRVICIIASGFCQNMILQTKDWLLEILTLLK